MSLNTDIRILIAEDNDVSRELMAGVLKTQNYTIVSAGNGSDAITAIERENIDLALVDLNMAPTGGFEFIKYLLANKIDVPVIVITADDSSDVLMKANDLRVTRILQKPVEPDRLLSVVGHVLKKYGHAPKPLAVDTISTRFTPEQLMQRAVELAERNARNKKGGPFGAVVAGPDGEILGEGTNGITSRIDPTAHAEIMAIRKAAEKLGRADLADCILFCSSEPTMMGQALIISVGIKKVYYGLSHSEINTIRTRDALVRKELSKAKKKKTEYIQLGHDHALKVLQRWEALEDKLSD